MDEMNEPEYNDFDATSCIDDYNRYEENELFNDHDNVYDLEDQCLDSSYDDRYDDHYEPIEFDFYD
jgi:hypothetical protein